MEARWRSYNKEAFIKAVDNSDNIRQAILFLGKSEKGRAYTSFRNAAQEFGIDISHIDRRRNNIIKIDKYKLIDVVTHSRSINSLIRSLGMNITGATRTKVIRLIKKYNIDTSHFIGQGWRKGKTYGFTYPIDDYLSGKRTITSTRLKNRLIREGLKPRICEKCNNTEWNNKPIPLELHHKDGNRLNNSLHNISILCPNCHAITEGRR